MKFILKVILLPFALLYVIGVRIRNLLYDWGVFSSTTFKFPVIVIGNLSVGGTGKTPHTEFILDFLRQEHQMACLSRGYGRKTKGFKIADSGDTPKTIGDEPYQIFSKIENIIVAVDEKRKRGIKKLRSLAAKPEVIVLDDAYQHRQVKAGLNILITEYSNLYVNDLPLPSGRLREPATAAKRADIIIVSKSPEVLSPIEKTRILNALKVKHRQTVYFSYIVYKNLHPLNIAAVEIDNPLGYLKKSTTVLLSAIANPKPMYAELNSYSKKTIPIQFKDHHFFEVKDYAKINKRIDKELGKKAIICSEKDAVKIDQNAFGETPLFSLPIKVKFHENKTETFKNHIREYVRSYTAQR